MYIQPPASWLVKHLEVVETMSGEYYALNIFKFKINI